MTQPRGTVSPLLIAAISAGNHLPSEMAQWIKDKTDGGYAPGAGSIYPRLQSLELRGVVSKEGARRSSQYKLTAKGRTMAEDGKAELARLIKQLKQGNSPADLKRQERASRSTAADD